MLIRRVAGAVLAAALGVAPVAPPEHVHDSEAHGHHERLVHRHSEAHAPHHDADHSPVAPVDPDHDGVLDEHGTPVLTIQTVGTVASAPFVPAPPESTPVVFVHPPAGGSIPAVAGDVELLIHGPPRAPASLRAPPSFDLL